MLKFLDIQQQHLIIFTRYPEPGKTKTRLIPALGAVGAANLQRQMTEHTILQVQALQKTTPISWEVRFTGGNLQLMADWLGYDLLYHTQGEGDLGSRMGRSLTESWQSGAQKVIIIGVDCPGINAHILTQAFEQLHTHDLVLGPAIDGGYYLIGLCRPFPELLFNIHWGTSQVLQQTMNIAENLKISVSFLPPLGDVDLPEDLAIWQQYSGNFK
ncbi:TIGR04282 family arsenosugar biosynthesis glycosyltransferase [Anabaenopsis tanganyikae CS-531]|uniref:TIGR04282 family arsenosugar biosynthesis glycosyltransferase n=2 Tax=Anabaenopsis TaxID=110103 RepID=A0ABT6KB07_9CYAN|nr:MULTISPECIES: TIGR04282 family arsenosugar biosynthesis glycosyltransferase [Anabaenopsis]MDB9538417.1 TIGR04282 family arsenosugar biosynthesis glycosyltransferase [Anabaenopsis arnoldii]MDH6090684.1 TIGR04282 family arsenosugar biosynthesis glycosyltransferase [Anabaenopsis arnoldii]MDH6104988.1 TIGR04282 family arsenosugar biosynthesis glycosyltransferase [Anabaenopsis tanganyikae CS-531]